MNPPAPHLVFDSTLAKEIYTATQLLSAGLNKITSPDWFASEPAVAFTCLSSGIERVLKLTYGMSTRHDQNAFPTNKALRQLGHDLPQLEGLVTADLTAAAAPSERAYVRLLLEQQTADPYWADILRTIAAWADQSGRYRDLTILTGSTVPDESPSAIWQDLEMRCITDLGLMADIAGPDSRQHLSHMRTRLAQSVVLWWSGIFRSWTHGLLGQDAVSPGTALNPATTRQLSKDLIQHARAL